LLIWRGIAPPFLTNKDMLETKIIKEKKRFIYSSFYSQSYSSKFFFKSILHHVISLEVYENNNSDGISFETICSNVPKSIGSRSSIQSILNDALKSDIFFKFQCKKDKRIKNYYLSDTYFDLIKKWIKKEESYFTNRNGG